MSSLDDLFYSFERDYGIDAIFVKVGKGIVNLNTGERIANDSHSPIRVVETPRDRTIEYLRKSFGQVDLSGKSDQVQTGFLVRIADIPQIEIDIDYLQVGILKYRNLTIETFQGIIGILSGVASE